jgi:REP element-mobilizing transposase RayT
MGAVPERPRTWFVTTTAAKHLRAFDSDVAKRIIVDAPYHIHAVDSAVLYAFVVMPNHVHFIVRCDPARPLGAIMRDFKANSARLIVRQFQAERNAAMLARLANAVTRPNKQDYKLWEDGYLAKEIFTGEFLWQKLEYIHHNPLQERWQLAERSEDYVWSSARQYVLNKPALIPIEDARLDWG